jgi:hypothetical protein
LYDHSHTVAETASGESVRLDQFVYTRPSDGRILWYSFSGGQKWSSTMSVLFAFALRRPVHAMNLDAYYFRHSGVLAIGSGGNHRMLAQVFWGDPVQFGEAISVLEEDETDPGLAQALLNIESQTACAGIQGTVRLDVDEPEQ